MDIFAQNWDRVEKEGKARLWFGEHPALLTVPPHSFRLAAPVVGNVPGDVDIIHIIYPIFVPNPPGLSSHSRHIISSGRVPILCPLCLITSSMTLCFVSRLHISQNRISVLLSTSFNVPPYSPS